MSDAVREAFLYYIPREQLDGQSAEDALLPLESIPAALERLLLDGDDDMALSVLGEAAEPLGRGRGVPYEPWKEVVQVLLDQRMVEDKELERVQRHVDAEQEGEQRQGPSRRRRQPTRAAAQAAQPVAMEEQSDSMEDDHQETYQGRRRRGLNKPESDGEEEDDMDEEEYDQDDEDEEDEEDEEGGFLPIPSKRKRNVGPSRRNKLTETHRGRAEHVFGLFLGQLPEKRTRLEAQDLVIVAKKMGDSLSLTEVCRSMNTVSCDADPVSPLGRGYGRTGGTAGERAIVQSSTDFKRESFRVRDIL